MDTEPHKGAGGEVHLPLVGNVKKHTAIIGGVVFAGVLGIVYFRYRKGAASTSASPVAGGTSGAVTAGDTYPPDGTTDNPSDPYSTDSATGQTYGNESTMYSAGGDIGSISPYQGTSDYGGAYYGPINPTTANVSLTTNAEWAQQVENDLSANGVDTATAATALSKILAGLQVTQAQADLFKQGMGLEGPPPQSYPQPIKISSAGTGSGSQSALVTVPNVVGMTEKDAASTIQQAHLHPHGPPVSKVAGVTQVVTAQNPATGHKVTSGSTVSVTVRTTKPAKPPVKKK